MNEKVISYDLGTGGIKASLFNRNGEALHSVFIPYPTVYPQPGWQEQAPEDWWQAIIRSTRHLLDKTKIDKNKITALAISGHRLPPLSGPIAGPVAKPKRSSTGSIIKNGMRQPATVSRRNVIRSSRSCGTRNISRNNMRLQTK